MEDMRVTHLISLLYSGLQECQGDAQEKEKHQKLGTLRTGKVTNLDCLCRGKIKYLEITSLLDNGPSPTNLYQPCQENILDEDMRR